MGKAHGEAASSGAAEDADLRSAARSAHGPGSDSESTGSLTCPPGTQRLES